MKVWVNYRDGEYSGGMRFAPPELSQAIGSISETGRHLKTTIAKLNVK